MLIKSTFREIKHSLGRYIAILAIVALGVGFFAGLKVTKEAMVSTADQYLQQQKLFDYELISTLGFEDVDVDTISQVSSVKAAEGSINQDFLYTGTDNVDRVVKAHSITSKINTLQLESGRMPKNDKECVVDNRMFSKSSIGDYVSLSKYNSSDVFDKFKYDKYKIVGIVESPLYLNFERGSSSLGNGSVSGFIYIDSDAFTVDYYTEIYIRLNNNYTIYSDQYNNAIEKAQSSMEKACADSGERRYSAIVSEAQKKLSASTDEYNANYNQYLSEKAKAYSKLESSYDQIVSGESSLAEKQTELTSEKAKLEQSSLSINSGLNDIVTQRNTLEQNKPYMTLDEYNEAVKKLDETEKNLKATLVQVNMGLSQIATGQSELNTAKEKLKSSKAQYYTGKAEADKKFSAAKASLDEGKNKLDDAASKISSIEKPKTYVLDRDTNVGYVSFESDSNIVNAVARVFPIFFFLVAALVCMTTMTRMIDEQRTQIGVFKALGYSNRAIRGKYLFYSGSAALIGAVVGFLGGCYLFPMVIWRAYGIMYDFNGSINYIFNWKLAIISLAVALLCSMGSTWISCSNDFKIVPAELIRPKSPKNGKRILLEKINFIWSKVSFLYKVTLRNIFRYKKRFLMMILGISGCTALLVTGLGVNDSIKNIVNFQYDEIVIYDYSVIFDENQSTDSQATFTSNGKSYMDSVIFVHEGSADLVTGKKITDVKSVKLIVSDGKNIGNFIDLHSGSKSITYPKKGQVVICEKLANQYDIDLNDTIQIRDDNMNTMDVKVSGICENYIYNYIYVSPETCADQWGYVPEYKTAYVNSSDDTIEGVHKASAETLGETGVLGTAVNNDMRDRVNKMMESLNAVIILIVLAAGALAFIVLYNLTNINITERIREIATIKVLGFYPKEAAAYVFREIFILTGISALVGLFLGKLLHKFVMSQIQIDLISFDVRISAFSYILSILLTFGFAAIVSLVMYFKLQKISMTESLKSIE